MSGVWNLTGETWGWAACRPLPNEPTSGMWQLGLRYDKTNLNDDPILGGEEHNLTFGVNWYWRSNFKFMVNYVKVNSSATTRSLRTNVDDNPNIIEARAQFIW